MWENSSAWYPITLESLGLPSTTASELTVSSGGTKPGREDPPFHVGNADGLGDCAEPQMVYALPYWWNGCGIAAWKHEDPST